MHHSSRQVDVTEDIEAVATRLLQFLSAHPTFRITYHPIAMRLILHSDASYHLESGACSCISWFAYLVGDKDNSVFNGPIECVSTIADAVCPGAHETEYAAEYVNGQ